MSTTRPHDPTPTPPLDPLGHLADDLAQVHAQGLYRPLRVMSSANRTRVTVDGREAITLASNNYLGLNTHPRLIEASLDALRRFGAGSGAVRTISGTMALHEELEAELARFKHVEAALTFQSGFTCNTGVIPVVAAEPDLIVSDASNHASIIDGMRLSKAPRVIYRHKDLAHLRELLATARREGRADGQPYRAILVVTDGVFSMDGDIAPMDKIVKLANEYGAMTYVDDAHGEGVIGPDGRGIGAHYHIEGKIDVEMGTFSKAYGVVGGLIAGSRDLVNFAYNKSRTWLLSGSHPPAVAGAQLAAIQVLETEPQHVRNLWENTRYFKKELSSLGFNTGRVRIIMFCFVSSDHNIAVGGADINISIVLKAYDC